MNLANLRGWPHWPRIMLAVSVIPLVLAAVWIMSPSHPDSTVSPPHPEPVSNVDPQTRLRIDAWLEANHRNRFGDPPTAQYTGGTPLFDPRTGVTRDRYEYILSRHPELRLDKPTTPAR